MKYLFWLILFSTPAGLHAEERFFVRGLELHQWCQSEYKMASGYILGAWEQYVAISLIKDREWLCVPQEVRPEQLIETVCNGLQKSPETRHLMGSMLAADFILEGYRCSPPR